MLAIALLLSACRGSEQSKVERLAFTVVDSLLGDTLVVGSTGVEFRAPVQFAPVADSAYRAFSARVAMEFEKHSAPVKLEHYRTCDQHGAIMQTVFFGLNDEWSDANDLTANLAGTVRAQYGIGDLRFSEFMVNNAVVQNFMVTDSTLVRMQLLVSSPGQGVALILYLVPVQEYASIVRSLESSIGTITLKRQMEE